MTDHIITPDLTENLGDSKNSSIALTFGNFQTQICGAMSMGLLQSQSEIAKTGAKIAEEFTKEQTASYHSQSKFLLGGYNAALRAAHKQAVATRWGAYGDFVSGGFGALAASGMIREGTRSETAQKLKTSQDKLAQQNHLLDLAHKNPPQPVKANLSTTPTQTTGPDTYREEVVQQRAKELSTEGASSPRELSNSVNDPTSKRWARPGQEPPTEAESFKQKPYSRDKEQYYNDKATSEEVSRGTATRGAYYIKDLDDEAIQGMTSEQHTKFIPELKKSIESTKLEINTLSNHLQRHTQMLSEGLQIFRSCASGTSQMFQATNQAKSKRADAQSQLANNSGSIAGGIVQNANSAKEGGLSTAQNAMQSFGRVYDGMRG